MPTTPSAAPRTLLVAEDEDSGRAIASQLGAEFESTLRLCARPDHTLREVEAHRPDVVVFALASIEAVELHALALQAPGSTAQERPFVLVLCDSASVRFAAGLCKQGLIDDYVPHFPTPLDPDRLATSLRLARRVVAAGAVVATGIAAAATRRRAVVLVVEDDEVLHHLVAAMIDADAVELVFESDGAAALDRIRAVAPDLVLMDVLLPGADGVDLTQRMKNTPELAAIPVVMFTGEARMETLLRSMEAGAADFLVKPFTREALVAKLSKYLPIPA
jgi:two-component system alkaline phosphatase synthesis response regulator PhoP